jgi:hypothetical protein
MPMLNERAKRARQERAAGRVALCRAYARRG